MPEPEPRSARTHDPPVPDFLSEDTDIDALSAAITGDDGFRFVVSERAARQPRAQEPPAQETATRERAARDTAVREAPAREKAARETPPRERATRESASRDQARERSTRDHPLPEWPTLTPPPASTSRRTSAPHPLKTYNIGTVTTPQPVEPLPPPRLRLSERFAWLLPPTWFVLLVVAGLAMLGLIAISS